MVPITGAIIDEITCDVARHPIKFKSPHTFVLGSGTLACLPVEHNPVDNTITILNPYTRQSFVRANGARVIKSTSTDTMVPERTVDVWHSVLDVENAQHFFEYVDAIAVDMLDPIDAYPFLTPKTIKQVQTNLTILPSEWDLIEKKMALAPHRYELLIRVVEAVFARSLKINAKFLPMALDAKHDDFVWLMDLAVRHAGFNHLQMLVKTVGGTFDADADGEASDWSFAWDRFFYRRATSPRSSAEPGTRLLYDAFVGINLVKAFICAPQITADHLAHFASTHPEHVLDVLNALADPSSRHIFVDVNRRVDESVRSIAAEMRDNVLDSIDAVLTTSADLGPVPKVGANLRTAWAKAVMSLAYAREIYPGHRHRPALREASGGNVAVTMQCLAIVTQHALGAIFVSRDTSDLVKITDNLLTC